MIYVTDLSMVTQSLPDFLSQIDVVASKLADAKYCPQGDQDTSRIVLEWLSARMALVTHRCPSLAQMRMVLSSPHVASESFFVCQAAPQTRPRWPASTCCNSSLLIPRAWVPKQDVITYQNLSQLSQSIWKSMSCSLLFFVLLR